MPSRIPPVLFPAMVLQYSIGGAFLPFVTLYLRDRGLEYSQLGWVLLVSSAVSSTVPFLWGYLADRWLALEHIIAALHAGGATALLCLAARDGTGGILPAYLCVSGTYWPTLALLNALCYHNLDAPERIFGKLRLWGSVGWMLPSLPVFLWLAFADDMDLGFTLYLASALEACMAAFALLLPHTPPGVRRRPKIALPGPVAARATGRYTYREALKRLVHRRGFLRFLVVVFLMHCSFAILFYYSPPYLENAGFAAKWIGPLLCIGVAVEVPLFYFQPTAIRRLGYRTTIAIGCSALLLRQLLYAAPAPPWLLAGSYVLAGVCVVFYLTTVSLALNQLAGPALRATAQSLLLIVGPGLGQMSGHRAAAVLADVPGLGLQAVFLFASLATALALILVLSLPRDSLREG